jgi:hypothetical protein
MKTRIGVVLAMVVVCLGMIDATTTTLSGWVPSAWNVDRQIATTCHALSRIEQRKITRSQIVIGALARLGERSGSDR